MGEEKEITTPQNIVKIEEAGPCKKKVAIEIPQEAIKAVTDEQYDVLRKDALVPGFRKGRAPRRLLEKRFGKETSEQIKLKLLAEASDSAVKDNKLDILGDPDIDHEKIDMPDDGPMKFDFEVEVRPDIDLPELEGIPVKKTTLEVTDDNVKQEIEQLQKYSGMWAPRDGGEVALDDQIIADAVIKIEGVEEDEKLNDTEIHVRENGFVGSIPVEKLDKLLLGAKAGQSKQITTKVPKTYFREEYRGKKVDIQIEVKDIKWLKPAELNEDFLKRFGVENETELQERLRDSLQSQLEQRSRTEMTEQIYEYMLEKAEFDLPLDVVADQATTLLQRQYASLMQRGLPREQLEEQMGQLQASSEDEAKKQLKTFFIMDKVAEKLKIEVTQEEINGHIAQLAIQQRQRPEKLKEEMAKNGSLGQFELQVRENKCIGKLLESAKITEIKPKKKSKKAKETTKTAKKTEKTTKKTEETTKKVAKKTVKKTAKKKTDK